MQRFSLYGSIFGSTSSSPNCRACHQQIAHALRHQLGLLQPEEIREGRKQAKDITQELLAQAIDAAVATVSRWETATVIQSRRADKALRRFFASQTERPLVPPAS